LLGPIPLAWLAKAASLPGKALALGLAIWFAKTARKTKVVALTPDLVKRFGVTRKPSYRALDSLETAGLVSVDRKRGRCPRVELSDTEDSEG
jgi:hypothetical protein